MAKVKDHYKRLGVAPNATAREIRKARNRLLSITHPDHNPDLEKEATSTTREILAASDVLLDEEKRAEYDRVYRNLFEPAVRARPVEPPKPPEQTRDREEETSLCPDCGRVNKRRSWDYCIYCGAGIGDNPHPFSVEELVDFGKKRWSFFPISTRFSTFLYICASTVFVSFIAIRFLTNWSFAQLRAWLGIIMIFLIVGVAFIAFLFVVVRILLTAFGGMNKQP